MVKIKRVYEAPARDDGYRVLVDRLWPRGVQKATFSMKEWIKELAPSDELRRFFGHDPEKWNVFKRRYMRELRSAGEREQVERLVSKARRGSVTLLYAARDREHNNAQVLKEEIERRLEKSA